MKIIQFLLLSGSLFLIGSCKKSSSDSPTTTTSRTQLLTQKAWVRFAGREKNGNSDWIDDFSGKAACEKDDQYVWLSDGTFNYNNGATKCSAADPQIFDQGTWVFTANETVLSTQTTGGGGDDLTIIQLDNTTLIFQEQLGSTTIEYSLKH